MSLLNNASCIELFFIHKSMEFSNIGYRSKSEKACVSFFFFKVLNLELNRLIPNDDLPLAIISLKFIKSPYFTSFSERSFTFIIKKKLIFNFLAFE